MCSTRKHCPIRAKWRADYRASRLIRHYERDLLRPAGLSGFRFMPGGISPAASYAALGNRCDSLSFPRGHICRQVGGPWGPLP